MSQQEKQTDKLTEGRKRLANVMSALAEDKHITAIHPL